MKKTTMKTKKQKFENTDALQEALKIVPGAHAGFIGDMCSEFEGDPVGQEALIQWIRRHPNAGTDRVLAHVYGVENDFFYEDENEAVEDEDSPFDDE